MKISSSEINTFMRCKKKWNYSSQNKMSLVGVMFNKNLIIGSGIHEGLEAYHKGEDPEEAINSWFDKEKRKLQNVIWELQEVRWDQDTINAWRECQELCIQMIIHYILFYEDPNRHKQKFSEVYEVIATEQPFDIPLFDDIDLSFAGTFDAILRHRTTGEMWIMEHKTYTQSPQRHYVTLNNQSQGYIWAATKIFEDRGIDVAGTIYNGLAKKLPKTPRLLNNGSMSVQMIETSELVAREALRQYALKLMISMRSSSRI